MSKPKTWTTPEVIHNPTMDDLIQRSKEIAEGRTFSKPADPPKK